MRLSKMLIAIATTFHKRFEETEMDQVNHEAAGVGLEKGKTGDAPAFTKGPWRAELGDRLSDGESCWVVDSELGSICEIQSPLDAEEANAHLIAASPALYEVAEQVRDWYEGRIPNLPLNRTALYDKACAALSLARGQKEGER
jgi:hypothetical protein